MAALKSDFFLGGTVIIALQINFFSPLANQTNLLFDEVLGCVHLGNNRFSLRSELVSLGNQISQLVV